MKNLKKVLAMVLAFACTFSMFAGAKVFEDVPAGSDYSEAITMLSDLGVIQGKDDGKYHPEDTITRAEACAMIARLMTGDPNVSQYVGAQSFTDVAKGSWKDSAIGYCYINGIVIGVGNNKFEPDRAITDAEFITMVVRAMGYETADMKQNYPYSYMSNAQAIGLLDGTNMVASTDALRGEDAQVIYNALFTDYARGAKLVNTTHGTSVETYPTLAESVWGLTRAAAGTWNKKDDETATLEYCKAHTWVVIGADPTAEGHILAYPISDNDGDLYAMDKEVKAVSFKYDGDASAVAGYQVELWGEGSHGEPEWNNKEDKYVYSEDWTIKAIKTVKGQTAYDYNASMADSKSTNGTIELGETSLDLEAVAANAKKIDENEATDSALTTYLTKEKYNGTAPTSDESVEKVLNVRDGAQYKLMDWDSDGDVDWVVVSEANYYKVEAVNSTRLTVSSMDTKDDVEEEQDSKNVTWKLDDLTEIDKVKYDFNTEEDLAEGDIIEVTYSIAYDKGEKEEVVTATITKVEADTAELDKVSTKDDLELTFDGEVKKIADNESLGDTIVPANPATYGQFDDEELGTQFNLWTNRNGFIVYSDYANETVNYLMVLDTGAGSDKTGDRKLATMDVLYADNSVKKDVEVVSDLKLTGYDKDDRTWTESEVVGNVYKYWMNEDGVITKMEAAIDVADAESNTEYSYDESIDRLKDKAKGKGNFVASLEGADVIFAVTENDAGSKSDNEGYIEVDASGDYKVDAKNVLAVKQSDIPDIAMDDDDTQTVALDAAAAAPSAWGHSNTWLGAKNDAHFIASVNGNGEASAAILGVENFNKFNAANTTVGLVTSVSYDKNDVVEIEVAYNGEVTTVKSAEDVDFEDVVKEYDVATSSDKDLDTKGAAALLKDNAAYAEITTNADGVLTAVTFMDVNDNVATGHYYQVTRRIITDVTSGDVAYGTSKTVYYNNKNLYSVVDRLKVEDKDLADEVDYYTVAGRPTIAGDPEYKNQVLEVANGFDGTPSITAETDSNLIESYINNKFDDADTYYVADLAYKIDGEIVAAYAFESSLGETDKATDGVAITAGTTKIVNDGADKDIADVVKVVSNDGIGNDTKVTVYNKDGKTVAEGITGKIVGTDLFVNAAKGTATGKYIAKFTFGGNEYSVDFTVEASNSSFDLPTMTSATAVIGDNTIVVKVADDVKASDFTDAAKWHAFWNDSQYTVENVVADNDAHTLTLTVTGWTTAAGDAEVVYGTVGVAADSVSQKVTIADMEITDAKVTGATTVTFKSTKVLSDSATASVKYFSNANAQQYTASMDIVKNELNIGEYVAVVKDNAGWNHTGAGTIELTVTDGAAQDTVTINVG